MMRVALTYILLFLIFSILFVLPSIIFPIPMDQRPQRASEPVLLLIVLLVDIVSIIYFIKRLNLRGVKLFLAVLTVFWGVQTFMTQTETWYFREAMPAITNEVLIKLFLNPLITAIIFIPLAMGMLGKWKTSPNDLPQSLHLKSKWKEILGLAGVYVLIYFLFGHYVAWQFREVRLFYSGSPELPGFIEQFQHNLRSYPFILPFQLVRGFLWVFSGLPIVLYLRGTNIEKMVACVIIYSILPSIQLIIDNPFMPPGVRFAHLLEVAMSNGLFGMLMGLVFSSRQIK